MDTTAKVTMEMDLDDLICVEGYDGMNSRLDEFLEEQGITHIPMDIDYVLVGKDETGTTFLVEANYSFEEPEDEESYEG